VRSLVNLCLLGYSGHGIVVAEALQLLGYQGFSYAERKELNRNPFQLDFAGFEAEEDFPWYRFATFALGIGDNELRATLAEKVMAKSKTLHTILHPQSLIAEGVEIGAGSFVARGVCINPLAQIGAAAIINTSAVIEHECQIHDYAHVAPSATLAGNVTVKRGAFIGANAVIKQGVSIGKNAIIGAGSVVLNDVPDSATVVGNPGKSL
jgi:acetyltransferase EpsM